MNELKHLIVTTVTSHFESSNEYSFRRLDEVINDVFTSLGACEKCSGKGYILTTISGDIHQKESTRLNADYCQCSRGKELFELVDLL